MTHPDDIQRDLNYIATTTPTPEQQAQAVIEQFMEWATNPRLAVLDTETTGLDVGEQVIEIGIVDAYGRTLMNQRVKPTIPVSAGAQQIHGISDDDLKDCPTFDQIWPQLWEILQTHDVVIFNKAFDMDRLCDSLNAALPDWWKGDGGPSDLLRAWWAFGKSVGCAMLAYAPIYGHWTDWGGYRWPKLAVACAARGVGTSDLQAHSALDDAQATLRLIRAAAEIDPATLTWIGREGEA